MQGDALDDFIALAEHPVAAIGRLQKGDPVGGGLSGTDAAHDQIEAGFRDRGDFDRA